ncbi:hypothetical protein KIPB_008515, partial [Kipferlia bialata]
FPDSIDMAEYMADPSSAPPGSCEYTLQGVVVHAGVAGSGHYYAYTRVPGQDSYFELNDSTVRRVPKGVMTGQAYGKGQAGTSAYILLYSRQWQGETVPSAQLDFEQERLLSCQASQMLNYRHIKWMAERVVTSANGGTRIKWVGRWKHKVEAEIKRHYTLNHQHGYQYECNNPLFVNAVLEAADGLWSELSLHREGPLSAAEALTTIAYVRLMASVSVAIDMSHHDHVRDLVMLAVTTYMAIQLLTGYAGADAYSHALDQQDLDRLWLGCVRGPSALSRGLCRMLLMAGMGPMGVDAQRVAEGGTVDKAVTQAVAHSILATLPTAVERCYAHIWDTFWGGVQEVAQYPGMADELVRQGMVWKVLDLQDAAVPRYADSVPEAQRPITRAECLGVDIGPRLYSRYDVSKEHFDRGLVLQSVVRVLSTTTPDLAQGDVSPIEGAHLDATSVLLSDPTSLNALLKLGTPDVATIVLQGRFDRPFLSEAVSVDADIESGPVPDLPPTSAVSCPTPSQAMVSIYDTSATDLVRLVHARDKAGILNWCAKVDSLGGMCRETRYSPSRQGLVRTIQAVVSSLLTPAPPGASVESTLHPLSHASVMAPVYLCLAKHCLTLGVCDECNPDSPLMADLLTRLVCCHSQRVRASASVLILASIVGVVPAPDAVYSVLETRDTANVAEVLGVHLGEESALRFDATMYRLFYASESPSDGTVDPVCVSHVQAVHQYTQSQSLLGGGLMGNASNVASAPKAPDFSVFAWLLDVLCKVQHERVDICLGSIVPGLVECMSRCEDSRQGSADMDALSDTYLAMLGGVMQQVVDREVVVEPSHCTQIMCMYQRMLVKCLETLPTLCGSRQVLDVCALSALARVVSLLLQHMPDPLACVHGMDWTSGMVTVTPSNPSHCMLVVQAVTDYGIHLDLSDVHVLGEVSRGLAHAEQTASIPPSDTPMPPDTPVDTVSVSVSGDRLAVQGVDMQSLVETCGSVPDACLPALCCALQPLFVHLSNTPPALMALVSQAPASLQGVSALGKRVIDTLGVFAKDICQRDMDTTLRTQPLAPSYTSALLYISCFVDAAMALYPNCVEEGHPEHQATLKALIPKCGVWAGGLIALCMRQPHSNDVLCTAAASAAVSLCSHRGNTYKKLAQTLATAPFVSAGPDLVLPTPPRAHSAQGAYLPMLTCLNVGIRRVGANLAGQVSPDRAIALVDHIRLLGTACCKASIVCLDDAGIHLDYQLEGLAAHYREVGEAILEQAAGLQRLRYDPALEQVPMRPEGIVSVQLQQEVRHSISRAKATCGDDLLGVSYFEGEEVVDLD